MIIHPALQTLIRYCQSFEVQEDGQTAILPMRTGHNPFRESLYIAIVVVPETKGVVTYAQLNSRYSIESKRTLTFLERLKLRLQRSDVELSLRSPRTVMLSAPTNGALDNDRFVTEQLSVFVTNHNKICRISVSLLNALRCSSREGHASRFTIENLVELTVLGSAESATLH